MDSLILDALYPQSILNEQSMQTLKYLSTLKSSVLVQVITGDVTSGAPAPDAADAFKDFLALIKNIEAQLPSESRTVKKSRGKRKP